MTATHVREIPGVVGRLEALLENPAGRPADAARAGVVFGHPHPLHGGTMHTKAVYRATKALARVGCAVLRFNFRGVGYSEGTFDHGVGEQDDFRAGLDFMVGRYPGVECWAAGFSFGSYVALSVGATDERVTRLIGIAPPLATYDFSVLETCTKPKLFIQGSEDELFPIAQLEAYVARLPDPKQLIVIPGANHLFEGKVAEVADAIHEALGG